LLNSKGLASRLDPSTIYRKRLPTRRPRHVGSLLKWSTRGQVRSSSWPPRCHIMGKECRLHAPHPGSPNTQSRYSRSWGTRWKKLRRCGPGGLFEAPSWHHRVLIPVRACAIAYRSFSQLSCMCRCDRSAYVHYHRHSDESL